MKDAGVATMALSWSLVVATTGCYSTCPGGHDPGANPAGRACTDGSDCQVECVCQPPDATDDDGEGVVVGDCVGGTCVDADDICRDGCGTGTWTGEYCEVAE